MRGVLHRSTGSVAEIKSLMAELSLTTARPAFRKIDLAIAIGLFTVFVAVSSRLLVSAARRHVLLSDESPLLYHAGTLGFSYLDFGFIRRGVGGSIVSLLGPDRLLGTALFHMLAAAGVASFASWMIARSPRSGLQKTVMALLMVALMGRWAEDAGRTDLLVAALLGAATIACRAGRFVVACCCVAVAFAVHETGFIFGLPLLAALLLDRPRDLRIPRVKVWRGGAVLLAVLALYEALPFLPHSDTATMVRTVRAHLPAHEWVDWAIYFAVSGTRGVVASICQNQTDPTYLLHVACGLLVIALYVAVLRTRDGPSPRSVLVAALPPFVFLCLVANDTSRWTVLAAFNVWLLHASSAREQTAAPGPDFRWNLLVAMLAIPLIHSKTRQIAYPIYAPTPVIDYFVKKFGGPTTPSVADALARCDPSWRDVLDPPAAARH